MTKNVVVVVVVVLYASYFERDISIVRELDE